MTGAELRAWRERLGKDEAWIEGVLGATDVPANEHDDRMPGDGLFGVQRRSATEGNGGSYSARQVDAIRTAYRAALEAEERAQAGRGPEPVCPEGVGVFQNGITWVRPSTHYVGGVGVRGDGTMQLAGSAAITAECLEYSAALSRHRAAVHAASDRQRKLDAVRAAEEARDRALAALDEAIRALLAARREAGL